MKRKDQRTKMRPIENREEPLEQITLNIIQTNNNNRQKEI